MMRNLKLTVAYDGTAFWGFQVQPGELPTIQGNLETGISDLTGEVVRIVGSGRTDAGVHAAGQVVSFMTNSTIPVENWPRALNTRLPIDIRVIAAEEVPPDFHARFSAVAKTYRYLFSISKEPNPVALRYTWWVGRPLNLQAMQEAATVLVGKHDFKSFQTAGSSAQTSVRKVTESRLISTLSGDSLVPGLTGLIAYEITADGFLYNMVRNIVGVLQRIGCGKLKPTDLAEIMAARDRRRAGQLAPAQGLWLQQVWY